MRPRILARMTLAVAVTTLLAACGGAQDTPGTATAMPATATATPLAADADPAAKKGDQPWKAYMLSPSSHTVAPVAIYKTNGTVQNAGDLLLGKPALISGRGSYITLDFGKEVGGLVSLDIPEASGNTESLGLAFTEASDYVGPASDGSNAGINSGAGSSTDGAIYASVTSATGVHYAMPTASLRGGFRYLTLFLNSDGWVHVSNISLNFTPAPLMADPSAYPNYFYSNDDLLNKLWYAGAYTVQTNTIVPTQGRQLLAQGWDNSAVVSGGSSVLTDAAKRDRTVWSGDLGVSAATAFVSTADTVSVKNALQRMYDSQKGGGELPYSGPPFNLYSSDTYHLWTLIGTHTYYLYSGDKAWLDTVWPKYKAGMGFILAKVDGPHGLLNVTGTQDWARGGQGGENIEANVMLYRALATGAELARAEGDGATADSWAASAATLQAHVNQTLWDGALGAYRDNPGSTLYPQDGNSLAVWFGMTDSADKTAAVARYLQSNVGPLGAHTPEWGGDISCYAGSMQLMAMSLASRDVDALALMRRQWGYMYNHPTGGTKTFWEGFGADGGSGGYAAWFISHAHGWSTGPTSALTFFTLGIMPTGVKGTTYSVIPHPGDLTHVEGKLSMDGKKAVTVRYDHGDNGVFTMLVDSSTNKGSVGVVAIPKFGSERVVMLDGKAIWKNNAFKGADGIASADQDARYIYFRGVQPGKRSFKTKADAGQWNACADEGGKCVFDGPRGMRYGAGASFVYGRFSDGVACTNANFGDPAPNVAKHCEISDSELPPAPGLWTPCAIEGQACRFANTQTVAFGAEGSYRFAARTGPVACDVATLGDPLPGVAKHCYVGFLPANAGFEAPPTDTYQYAPADAGWSFSAQNGNNGSGIQKNESAFGARTAPEGVQTAFVQGNGELRQTLSDLPAGRYALAFQAARRGWAGGGVQTLGVFIDDQALGTCAPASTLFTSCSTAPVELAAGTHTLRVSGQNATGDNTAFVDAVAMLRY